MSRVAYLAHPIDQVIPPIADLDQQAVDACYELNRAGFHVYRPADAWQVDPDGRPDPRLEAVNRIALRQADLLVALLPYRVPTIGVPLEIAEALQLDIPVIAIHDGMSFSLARPGITKIETVSQLGQTLKALWLPKVGQSRVDPIRVVLQPGTEAPIRAYADDAGLDLTLAKDYIIESGQFVDMHTQVEAVQLPVGYWGLITGRSSALRRYRLHVPVAVIDPGWRGPLYVMGWNLGLNPVSLKAGERVGQLILVPNHPAPVVAVDQVAPAPRGLAGFGSTG